MRRGGRRSPWEPGTRSESGAEEAQRPAGPKGRGNRGRVTRLKEPGNARGRAGHRCPWPPPHASFLGMFPPFRVSPLPTLPSLRAPGRSSRHPACLRARPCTFSGSRSLLPPTAAAGRQPRMTTRNRPGQAQAPPPRSQRPSQGRGPRRGAPGAVSSGWERDGTGLRELWARACDQERFQPFRIDVEKNALPPLPHGQIRLGLGFACGTPQG